MCEAIPIDNYQIDCAVTGGSNFDFGGSLTKAINIGDSYQIVNSCFSNVTAGNTTAVTTVGTFGTGFCKTNGEFNTTITPLRYSPQFIQGVATCHAVGIPCAIPGAFYPGNNEPFCSNCADMFGNVCQGCSFVGSQPICTRTGYNLNTLQDLDPFTGDPAGFLCAEVGALSPDGKSLTSYQPRLGVSQYSSCNPNLSPIIDPTYTKSGGTYNTYCNTTATVKTVSQVYGFRYIVKTLPGATGIPAQVANNGQTVGGIDRIETAACQNFINYQLQTPGASFHGPSIAAMTSYCVGENLINMPKPICQSFFTNGTYGAAAATTDQNTTAAIMIYCTQGTNMEGTNPGQSFCQPVVQSMIKQTNGNGVVDNYLTSYCTTRGVTLANFATQSVDLMLVCDCHLSAQDYANYLLSLEQNFPALNAVSLGSTQCLLNNCAGSSFPNLATVQKGCPAIQCIQSVSNQFTNSVVNNITNTQSAYCAQFSGQANSSAGGGSSVIVNGFNLSPSPSQSQVNAAQSTQTALIAGLTVAAVVVVIAVIVGTLAGIKQPGTVFEQHEGEAATAPVQTSTPTPV
jgi:hypothetical protein